MDSNEIISTNSNSKSTINYEEAMDMLLKSLEKSEVFQLRRHITKMVLGVGVVLLIFNIFIMKYIISLSESTTILKENVSVLQSLAVQEVAPPTVEPIPIEETEPIEEDNQMVSIAQEYYIAMNDLMKRQECTEEWYLEYKALIDKYEDTVGSPDDLTEVFSEADLNIFYRCIETETHGASFAAKVNVANVILNRVDNPNKWGDTLTDVITSPGQFAYGKTNISDSTKLAAEYAYQFEDTTQGAEFFNSGAPNTNSDKYLFTDEAGHSFYAGDETETIYNIDGNSIYKIDDNIDEDSVG